MPRDIKNYLKWKAANRDRLMAQRREYEERNREKINRQQRERWAKNKESRNAWRAAWLKIGDHRKSVRDSYKRFYAKARLVAAWVDAKRKLVNNARFTNSEKYNTALRLRYKDDKLFRLKAMLRMRLRKLRVSSGSSQTKAYLSERLRANSNHCYWCGSHVKKSEVHIDHIIALSKGGTHNIENLCVSCARCNLKKNSMGLDRWTKYMDAPQLVFSI